MVHLHDIQKQQEEFVKTMMWDRFDNSLVFAHLIEEIGEIASYMLYEKNYKVKGAGHKSNISKENLQTEFAQVFNLFLQLASSHEVNLENAWLEEVRKNKDRFSEEQWKKLAKNAKSSTK